MFPAMIKNISKSILNILFVVALLCCSSTNIQAQNDFYDNNVIREIRLHFTQPDWDHQLDSLFIAGQKERLLASVNN